MSAVREVVTYRDAKGNTARLAFYVPFTTLAGTNTAASNVLTPLDAITNAHRQSSTGPVTTSPTEVVYGAASEFISVEDKAVFTFQSAVGAIHRFQVPAPLSSIFMADGETVDASNTAVTAFVSAVIANASDSNGNLLAFGGFGTRIRRKTRRKLNIYVKDPALTGPAE